ncbi:hypothetical protein KAI46_12025 [bacterium]|nr:hypothetical protein [bacterium]
MLTINREKCTAKSVVIILALTYLLVVSLFLTKTGDAQESASQSHIRVFYGGALMGQLEPCG